MCPEPKFISSEVQAEIDSIDDPVRQFTPTCGRSVKACWIYGKRNCSTASTNQPGTPALPPTNDFPAKRALVSFFSPERVKIYGLHLICESWDLLNLPNAFRHAESTAGQSHLGPDLVWKCYNRLRSCRFTYPLAPMKKLQVGLIGLGDQWTVRHAPALRALSDRFEVRAVCCEVAEKSRLVAAEFGAVATDGFRALIDRHDVDAVLALSPQWYGPLPIEIACQTGKAVYSSAALDVTPEQAASIHQHIRSSGIPFMAELPRRYAPATIRLKELIATRLGKPRLMFCHQRLPVEDQTHRLRRGQHCPLVWRNMMELVDWCRYLVGSDPCSVVSAAHGDPPGDVATYYQMASLEFPAQCGNQTTAPSAACPLVQLSIGHYIPQRWQDALSFRRPASLQVCCEHGMAFIDLPSSLIWFDDGGQHTESLDSERAVGEMMLDRFQRLVNGDLPHATDASDAYRAMKIVVGAHESINTGQRYKLEFDHP